MKTKLTEEQYNNMVDYFGKVAVIDKIEDILRDDNYYLSAEQLAKLNEVKESILKDHYQEHEQLVEEF